MAGIEQLPRVLLQPRDRLVLETLRIVRVADWRQLATLAGFSSRSRASSRLSLLTRAGYLRREYIGTIAGGRRALYCLPTFHFRAKRGPAGREAAVAHQIAINDVRAAVHLAAQNGSWRYTWQPGTARLAGALIPDAQVSLSGPAPQLYFLEADCGTEGISVWRRKIAAYLTLAQSADLERQTGSTRFRVLVVTPSQHRMKQLQRVVAAQTQKVFWLTTYEQLSSAGFLAPIWLRPVGAQGQALVKERYELLQVV